jgi:molecular chaperone GrpE
MPGPGHPGHFPKPPGWIDRTGGGARSSPAGAGPGGTPPPAGGSGSSTNDRPAPDTKASAGSRAEEAAAKVAGMLVDEDAEQVEQAEDAVEEDIEELTASGKKLAAAEAARDEYLDSLRRLQADFENYKKRIQRQQIDLKERAAEDLVVKLLPVLDNFDLAIAHAEQNVEPIYRSLLEILGAAGLERIDPANQPFDPNEHDAVLHEEGEGSEAPEVIEVLRAGYRWKGRVLRPAMVKVKG